MRYVMLAGAMVMGFVTVAYAGPGAEGAPAATAQAATQRAVAGKIVGVIESPSGVTRVAAVDRDWADPLKVSADGAKDAYVYDGKWDEKTGAFEVAGLLPGRTYDLIVWNKEGRWEGVDMAYHREIMPDKEITAEDKAWIHEFVEKMPRYEDKCRILWMAADHKHATVAVELMRTREFYSSKAGEITYRVELWYFENLFGGWAKDKNTEKVLMRWRGQMEKLPARQYVPALGGIVVPASGTSTALKVVLPEKGDEKRGTVGKGGA